MNTKLVVHAMYMGTDLKYPITTRFSGVYSLYTC